MKPLILFLLCFSTARGADFAAFIAHWEGFSPVVYEDVTGHKTIGYGHKVLPTEDLRQISQAQGLAILNRDIANAKAIAKSLVPSFDTMPEKVQLIVTDLAFTLGKAGLAKFKKTLAACNRRDFATMAKELRASKWYRQTTRRGKHHVLTLQEMAM